LDKGFANRGRARSIKGKKAEGRGIYEKPMSDSERKEREETLRESKNVSRERTKKTRSTPISMSPEEKKHKEIENFLIKLISKKQLDLQAKEDPNKISSKDIKKISSSLRRKLLSLYVENKENPIWNVKLTTDALIYLNIRKEFTVENDFDSTRRRTLFPYIEDRWWFYDSYSGELDAIDFSKPLPKSLPQLIDRVHYILEDLAQKILTCMILVSSKKQDLSKESEEFINQEMLKILKKLVADNRGNIESGNVMNNLLKYSMEFFKPTTSTKDQKSIKKNLNEFFEKLKVGTPISEELMDFQNSGGIERHIASYKHTETPVYLLYKEIPSLDEKKERLFNDSDLLSRLIKMHNYSQEARDVLTDLFRQGPEENPADANQNTSSVSIETIQKYIEFVQKNLNLNISELAKRAAYSNHSSSGYVPDIKMDAFLGFYLPIALANSKNISDALFKNVRSIGSIFALPYSFKLGLRLEFTDDRKQILNNEMISFMVRENILHFREVSKKELVDPSNDKMKQLYQVSGFYVFLKKTDSPEKIEALVKKIADFVKSKIDQDYFYPFWDVLNYFD